MDREMRIIIAGGGLGGLALAQGLKRDGFDVRVFDRDPSAAVAAGYRLHIDADGSRALRALLPPEVFQAILASSTGGRTFQSFGILDHHGRAHLKIPRSAGVDEIDIGRAPLRRLLAHGLEDVVVWNKRITGFDVDQNGGVHVTLDDGTTQTADLLIGADGAHSRVAARLLGHHSSKPTGVSAIAGRTLLDEATRPLLPEALRDGPAFALGPNGTGIFFSAHDLSSDPPRIAPDAMTQVAAIVEDDYLVWSIAQNTRKWKQDSSALAPTMLLQEALGAVRSWSSAIYQLIEQSDPHTIAWFDFRMPDRVDAWPSGAVTLLGDAAHAMPPTAGAGASTAIQDAADLLDRLVQPDLPLPLALHDYQAGMLARGQSTVSRALTPLRWQQRLTHPFLRVTALKALLPLLATSARFRSAK